MEEGQSIKEGAELVEFDSIPPIRSPTVIVLSGLHLPGKWSSISTNEHFNSDGYKRKVYHTFSWRTSYYKS